MSALIPIPLGALQIIRVCENKIVAHGLPLRLTEPLVVKLEPEIVMSVPPLVDPVVGDNELIDGALTGTVVLAT